MNRTQVTITNRNRAAVRSIGRRFRPGIPRTLGLDDNQLNVVQGNPWLWITDVDWDEEEASAEVDLEAFYDVELRELGFFLDIPGARRISRTELIEAIEEAREEVQQKLEDGDLEGYDDLVVDDLQDLLRERDLPVSGNRSDLIERLEEDDAESEPDSGEDSAETGVEE